MSKSFSIEKLVFRISLGAVAVTALFGYGYLVGKHKFPPHDTLYSAYLGVRSFLKFGELVPANRLLDAPADARRDRFHAHQPQRVTPGFYVVQGWDNSTKSYVAWLWDDQGTLQHTWKLDYTKYDADGPSNGTDSPHGFKVLPDGDLLLNFDHGDVLARVDACGDPVWTNSGVFHHSIERAEDGSYWTWRSQDSAYSHYQYLLNFNPVDGSTIREIGLIEDIMQATDPTVPDFLMRKDYPFDKNSVAAGSPKDLFHPNDIDVLYAKDAGNFDRFMPGDLLISLRSLNMVAVIDPTSAKVKWSSTGPWRMQHDPDFTRDGLISVYNNNTHIKRSEIISVDPDTGQLSNRLANGNLRFYSHAMGKHQYLPNGQVLVVVPGEGRMLVADSDGNLVLELNNLSDEAGRFNAHVGNGLWLPGDYFANLPRCPANR